MKVTLNTLNIEEKSVSKLTLAFEYDMSVAKDKHVISMDIDGTKYFVYVNDLTPAINAVITHQAANRNETYNDILQVDKLDELEEAEDYFEE